MATAEVQARAAAQASAGVLGEVPTQRSSGSEFAALWARLRNEGDQRARDQLIVGYSSLVHAVARRMPSRMVTSVDLDDLTSAGMFGLIDAIDKFDISRGVPFEPYAVSRIRGSIIDELRAFDWAPRSVRSRARDLTRAYGEFEAAHHRAPTHDELASHLGLDAGVVRAHLTLIDQANLAALDAASDTHPNTPLSSIVRAGGQYEPETIAQADATREILMQAVEHLGERTATLLRMYYFEGKTYAEVGKVLGVTESRISQIHTAALGKLRTSILAAEAG